MIAFNLANFCTTMYLCDFCWRISYDYFSYNQLVIILYINTDSSSDMGIDVCQKCGKRKHVKDFFKCQHIFCYSCGATKGTCPLCRKMHK